MDELILNNGIMRKYKYYLNSNYAINSAMCYYNNVKNYIQRSGMILNQENYNKYKRSYIKVQNQRAAFVAINRMCEELGIDFFIRVGRVKTNSEYIPSLLSFEEIKTIINSAPYPYNLVIRCIFNFGAGLRISEIIKMRWKDIRWIDWLEDKNNYGIVLIKMGKGSKDRVVNIPPLLMNDLYKYAKNKNLLNEFGVPIGGMVFNFGFNPNDKRNKSEITSGRYKTSEYWKVKYVKSRWKWFYRNILEKYCFPAINHKFRIHTLRHARATYLYEIEKVPIERIQLLLGHKSINTTMIYTKINPLSTFDLLKNTKEL